MEDLELASCIEIPWQQLSDDALDGLLEEFVTRDGTDYGEQETSLQSRKAQVKALLQKGGAVILFSEESAQCNIVAKDQLSF